MNAKSTPAAEQETKLKMKINIEHTDRKNGTETNDVIQNVRFA